MRETKLIFVEGLPGSGKSTAASWLAKRLQSTGREASLFLEHQPGHPLNVGGDNHPAGDTPGDVFFQSYTPASFIQESLERWQQFIGATIEGETIHVLDSYPYQNSVRVLLQLNADLERLKAYSAQVEALVAHLQPVLVYFSHQGSEYETQRFTQISEQRGKEWTEYVIDLVMRCPYAQARKLSGFEGILVFLREYHQLVNTLLKDSQIPRVILENCSDGWDGCYRRIEDFLGLWG